MDSDSRIGLYDPVFDWVVFFLDFCDHCRFPPQPVIRRQSLGASATQRSMEFYFDYDGDYGPPDFDVFLFFSF